MPLETVEVVVDVPPGSEKPTRPLRGVSSLEVAQDSKKIAGVGLHKIGAAVSMYGDDAASPRLKTPPENLFFEFRPHNEAQAIFGETASLSSAGPEQAPKKIAHSR